MELEEWIQEDMKRFLNEQMPDAKSKRPIRKEELSLVDNKDYTTLIAQALQNNRYRHATELFDELKQKFVDVPLDHQQERKAYYRILQKSYKLIYDYVADSHKTARILSQLEYKADVFDDNVESISVEELGKREGEPLPPVELAMIKAPQKEAHVDMPQMPPEKAITTEENKKADEPPETPDTPPELPEETTPSQDIPPKKDTQDSETIPIDKPKNITIHVKHLNLDEQQQDLLEGAMKAENRDPNAPTPSWKPPDPHAPMVQQRPTIPEEQQQKPLVSERAMRKRSAKEFARRAHIALIDGNLKLAQELLMEARIEIQRAGGDLEVLRRITNLERSIARHLNPDYRARTDQEIFSGTYMKGVQAMAAGDYKTAANLFYQRIQQAPTDRAARIRLAECMEVLYGQSH